MVARVQFDADLVRRYDMPGPRYTSYPTALQFHEGFDEVQYRRNTARSNDQLIPAPLSLYLHLPFCRSLCYYCGCTKKVTRHPGEGVDYLARLYREISMQGSLFDADRVVEQLHLGGGTPTFFTHEQLSSLIEELRRNFLLSGSDDREFSIEIDPRTVDPERLEALAELGFNRLSLGVQDFDPDVQTAVNRKQSAESVLELTRAARRLGYRSISFDLIYGLPLQTAERFEATLERVLDFKPDRLAVYNYAHLPHLFRSQRLIRPEDLPTPDTRLELLSLTIQRLTSAGYEYIGMDHFALPFDELCRAQRHGGLHRNFQGYSTRRECDLVGLGMSGIGKVGDCYVQNYRDLRTWGQTIDAGRLPIWRGIQLDFEDRLRAEIIDRIMCAGEVEFADIERTYEIDFADLFAPELERLQQLHDDGLAVVDGSGLHVTPHGRLLLRAVAMVFDEYLARDRDPAPRHSRVI